MYTIGLEKSTKDHATHNKIVSFIRGNAALAEETDPHKLHDLKTALGGVQVYSPEQMQEVVVLFHGGVDRDRLDPILDTCVKVYVSMLTGNSRWCSRARQRCSVVHTTILPR